MNFLRKYVLFLAMLVIGCEKNEQKLQRFKNTKNSEYFVSYGGKIDDVLDGNSGIEKIKKMGYVISDYSFGEKAIIVAQIRSPLSIGSEVDCHIYYSQYENETGTQWSKIARYVFRINGSLVFIFNEADNEMIIFDAFSDELRQHIASIQMFSKMIP